MSSLPIHKRSSPEADVDPDAIDYESLVTEDHKPVERILFEKLYRLWTSPLYDNWPGPGAGRPFVVLANVGWFPEPKNPALVPDCLLSVDVTLPPDLHVKRGHSYFQWDMGKPPDVVIEAVSDRRGGEESRKKDLYAKLGLPYYAVYDYKHLLSPDTLRTYALVRGKYKLTTPGPWPKIGLGLRLWSGTFEGSHDDEWLRWCDARGVLIPTSEGRAQQERERAKVARKQARQERERAEQAEERARQGAERTQEAEEQMRQAEARIRLLEAELKAAKDGRPN